MWAVIPFAQAEGKIRSWLGPVSFVNDIPTIRDHIGFAECMGKIYVFGGEGVTGTIYSLLSHDSFLRFLLSLLERGLKVCSDQDNCKT